MQASLKKLRYLKKYERYMNFDSILGNIARHVTLSPEEAEDFCSLLEVRRLKKKEQLVAEDDIFRYEGYINKGCLRTFFIDRQGIEHTFYFGIEDWWISDLYSRTFKQPSLYRVEALEDSELFCIKDEDLEAFSLRTPKMERFGRKMFQYSLAVFERRLLEEHRLTADERYRVFRQRYPAFDSRIPQKYIASFLGLTPEFFNKVRTRVLKES